MTVASMGANVPGVQEPPPVSLDLDGVRIRRAVIYAVRRDREIAQPQRLPVVQEARWLKFRAGQSEERRLRQDTGGHRTGIHGDGRVELPDKPPVIWMPMADDDSSQALQMPVKPHDVRQRGGTIQGRV
jgi:hypothetical protein